MRRYVEFYRANPNILKLHIFEFVVYFAAWFAEVAIYTLLLELNSPPWVIALITAMNFIPALLVSPISGILIDVVDSKKLLLAIALTQAVATFLMIFIDSYALIPLLGFLLFVKMASASMHFQTDMTIVAKLVKKDSLHIANEIQAAIWSFCYSAGMALSGFFVALYGVSMAFITDVLIILVAVPLLFFIEFPKPNGKAGQRFREIFIDGLDYVFSHKNILYLIVMHGIIGFMIVDVLVTLLVDTRYRELFALSVSIGLMNSFKAIGLTIGAPLLGRFVSEKNLDIYFYLLGGSFLFWSFFMDSFYLSLVALFFIGVFAALLWAFTYTMLQRSVEERFLGRTLAYNDMVFMFFGVVATVGIGFLYEAGISLALLCATVGIIFVTNGVVYKISGSKWS